MSSYVTLQGMYLLVLINEVFLLEKTSEEEFRFTLKYKLETVNISVDYHGLSTG